MRRVVVILMFLVVASGVAWADRLILAPKGEILPPGQFKIEGMLKPSGERPGVFWINAGVGQIELEGMLYDNGNGKMKGSVGAEAQLLPETLLTPAVGVGIRDIADNGLQGRAEYLAVTKTIPTEGLKGLVHDVKLHVGFGLERIDGFFAGAEAGLPYNLWFAAEHDSHGLNIAGGWSPVRNLQIRAYGLNGDGYFGLVLRFP